MDIGPCNLLWAALLGRGQTRGAPWGPASLSHSVLLSFPNRFLKVGEEVTLVWPQAQMLTTNTSR